MMCYDILLIFIEDKRKENLVQQLFEHQPLLRSYSGNVYTFQPDNTQFIAPSQSIPEQFENFLKDVLVNFGITNSEYTVKKSEKKIYF